MLVRYGEILLNFLRARKERDSSSQLKIILEELEDNKNRVITEAKLIGIEYSLNCNLHNYVTMVDDKYRISINLTTAHNKVEEILKRMSLQGYGYIWIKDTCKFILDIKDKKIEFNYDENFIYQDKRQVCYLLNTEVVEYLQEFIDKE